MSNSRFDRRAPAPLPRTIWHERLGQWSGGIILATAGLLFLVFMFLWRSWQVRDAAAAPLQTTNAIVLDKRVADNKGRVGSGWNITLQWNGQTTVANTHNLLLFNSLAAGETVAVSYRVGKSGQVYVADIAETASRRRAEQ